MTLVQKLTSVINSEVMISFFNLPTDYDYYIAMQLKKKNCAQKTIKGVLDTRYGR
jgi:hypothetical protein